MSPKRPPTDAITLRELGISDLDCGLDPDGLLDGPPSDETGLDADFEAVDEDDMPADRNRVQQDLL